MESGFEKKKKKVKKDKQKKDKKKKENTHHPHFMIRRNKLVEICSAVRNQISMAVLAVFPSLVTKVTDFELCARFAQVKEKNKELHATYTSLMRSLARDIFGVWQPKIILKSADNTNGGSLVSTGIAAVIATVVPIDAGSLASVSLIWAIFDEYRAVGPFRVFFLPSDTSTSRLYAIGVIDYSTSTPLNAVDEAMSYDTKQIFDVVPYHTAHSGVTEWSGRVVGIPDLTWVATGTNITWAYWKAYSFNLSDSSWSISSTYGYLTFEVEVEFRQLNQGG